MPSRPLVSALVLTFVAAGRAQAAEPPALSLYAADAAIESPAIAPDGKHIAYVAVANGRRSAIVEDQAGTQTVAASEGGAAIRSAQWLSPQHLLVFASAMIEGNSTLPRQRLTEGLIYNLSTRKAPVVLNSTPGALAILTGGSIHGGQS